MLEYSIEEAARVLSESLEKANKSLQVVADDLDFLKDQYVTTEVSILSYTTIRHVKCSKLYRATVVAKIVIAGYTKNYNV